MKRERLERWLTKIVQEPHLHGRWVNTLSYLENCGARLIARCEHPTLVTREILKHAAEEFRHAFFFKSLIPHLIPEGLPNYQVENLMGSFDSLHYIQRLNLEISRELKEKGLLKRQLIEYAYLLVTYAIEVRALELYTLYEKILKKQESPFSIKGVLREEQHHLKEISSELKSLPEASSLSKKAVQLETHLFTKWLDRLEYSS